MPEVITVLDPSTSGAVAGALGTSLVRPRPGAAVLAVQGEVDTLTAPPLERALAHLLADPSDRVLIVDMTDVTFLASSGLAVLIRAAHRAAERNLRLHLVTAARAVRRPLQITGSEQLFDMHEDVDAALGAPGGRD